VTTPAERFSRTAAGYAATMAPGLLPVNRQVIHRAALRPGERVLDIGTGTGTAASLARGEDREVVAIDAAPGMLDIARSRVAGVTFHEMSFDALDFDDESFDVVLAVHSLHFAEDRAATLGEWRRVTRLGGRLSASVPGPRDAVPNAFYAAVYARHGVHPPDRTPAPDALRAEATAAGWTDVDVTVDRETSIVLANEAAFRTWREIGFRGAATDHLSDADQHRLTDDMLAVTPRTPEGGYAVPFGTVYLAARGAG
jgi:ubiquinone/menaquinone biosynthesis C-methylase UbiE